MWISLVFITDVFIHLATITLATTSLCTLNYHNYYQRNTYRKLYLCGVPYIPYIFNLLPVQNFYLLSQTRRNWAGNWDSKIFTQHVPNP